MIVGITTAHAALGLVPSEVLVRRYPSVTALAVALVAGTCDWAIAEGPGAADTLTGICEACPASAVVSKAVGTGFRIVVSHPLVATTRGTRLGLDGMRFLWWRAWSSWIEGLVSDVTGHRGGPLGTVFCHALTSNSVPELAHTIGINERTLRRHLGARGVAGPGRLRVASRILRLWERGRLQRHTLEAIASDVGWSGLWPMNRAVRGFLGVDAREVPGIPPDVLAKALAGQLVARYPTRASQHSF